MASKEQTLARIRQALGRQKSEGAPDALPLFARRAAVTGHTQDLVNQFRRELEKVGGIVLDSRPVDDLTHYLESLLPPGERPTVAISDGAHARAKGIRERLSCRGVNVVPSFGEFVKAKRREVKESAARNLGDHHDAGLMEGYLG